jgi:type I restriction enzyme, S subunit
LRTTTAASSFLEEMAQRIYREWFVDFRYPGHESVPLVGSSLGPIPQGWRTSRLGDVVRINARTAKSLAHFETIDYVDIASVERGSVNERKRLAVVEAPGRARRLVKDGDVIWSTVRPNLRAYALILNPSRSSVVSTGFAVLSADGVPFAFLYALSTSDSFVSYLTNHATGSAYPAVTGRTFAEMPIVVPDPLVLERYSEIAEPALRLAGWLRESLGTLRVTRDLLLPRLVSGEIDVDNLAIELAEAA